MSTAAIVTEVRDRDVKCASCYGTAAFLVARPYCPFPDPTDPHATAADYGTPACVLHVGMWQRRLADVDAEAVTR